MLDAYRGYFMAVLTGDTAARDDARSAARSTRIVTQASLQRLRDEPRPDRALLDLAESVFVNANRFVRAAMTLKAVLHDTDATADMPPSGHTKLRAFAERIDTAMAELAAALRDGRPAKITTTLRAQQIALSDDLETTSGSEQHRDIAAALIDTSDRITDSVDALAQLLRRVGNRTAGTPPPDRSQ